eukprot:gnl/MRDRNA2_/MRDRNA2_253544_c0_seq1.p1 gnl/MRDRNA2_/MRDRNA2_253544_c0~~gnl/MRDRNA2_/MRDRNA2_253544_c0_seq1.p1  ORF type:complete len:211 (-),score=17.82 gnl/MRDRNA2_/MRDRNA2_253544_c0_seq1:146-712(-)
MQDAVENATIKQPAIEKSPNFNEREVELPGQARWPRQGLLSSGVSPLQMQKRSIDTVTHLDGKPKAQPSLLGNSSSMPKLVGPSQSLQKRPAAPTQVQYPRCSPPRPRPQTSKAHRGQAESVRQVVRSGDTSGICGSPTVPRSPYLSCRPHKTYTPILSNVSRPSQSYSPYTIHSTSPPVWHQSASCE